MKGALVVILALWFCAWIWTERANFMIVANEASDVEQSPEVVFVKSSALPSDSQTPIGIAFSSVSSGEPEWELGVSSKGVRFVEVKGTFTTEIADKVRKGLLEKDSDYVDLCKACPSVMSYLNSDPDYRDLTDLAKVQKFVISILKSTQNTVSAGGNDASREATPREKAVAEYKSAYDRFQCSPVRYRAQFLLDVPPVTVDCGKVVVGNVERFHLGYQEVCLPFAPKGFYGEGKRRALENIVLEKFD